MLTFCTLFDSNYLDKGLVLYDSMKSVMESFKLYILAMDDRCEEILNDLALEHAVVISLNEFEDEEMLEIKAKRSRAEYCWTCTASLIDYVFENYDIDEKGRIERISKYVPHHIQKEYLQMMYELLDVAKKYKEGRTNK